MMWLIDIASKMIDALAMVIILCMVYGALLRSLPSARLREVLLGAAFGLAGMMVMLSPVDFAPGMLIDPRALMVALPAAFGGLRAGVIAWVVVVTTRLSMGWPQDNPAQAMSLAMFGITSHLVGGLVWRWIVRRRLAGRPGSLVALSLAATVEFFALVTTNLPLVLSIPGLAEVIAVQHAVRVIGLWLGAWLMMREEALAWHDRENTELARLDPLTAVLNRRGFDKVVDADWLGDSYAVLCFDLDGFKAFNDRAGHGAGDRLLTEVADILRRTMPRDTIVARFGGDEFVVALRTPAAGRARALGRAVVDRVRAVTVQGPGEPVHRVSVGHAATTCGAPLAEVLREADKALYRAKARGGDRLSSQDRKPARPLAVAAVA